jgi:tRNA pseudouridine55 synthase
MNFQEGAYIYINKPYRMSSFGALAHIRYVVSKRLHVKRVKMGHAGTLDPLATGVLILCTGKATKQIEQLQLHTKEYTATLQLGATTASYDKEHTVDYTYPTRHITRELIEQTLPQFVGDILQVPPVYSACMVDGHRAYKMARKGEEVDLAAKLIHIDEIELTDFDPVTMLMSIRVVCGKGTYIRSLARDIGHALGSGAFLTALCRTRVGDVRIENCLTFDEFPAWLEQQMSNSERVK